MRSVTTSAFQIKNFIILKSAEFSHTGYIPKTNLSFFSIQLRPRAVFCYYITRFMFPNLKRKLIIPILPLGIFILISNISSRPFFQIQPAFAQGSHLECRLSQNSAAPVTINDTDSSIKYSGPWGASGDHDLNYHFAPYPLSSQTISTNYSASAEFKFDGNSVTLGSVSWINRGYMDIFIDGQKVDRFQMYAPGVHPITWTSPQLSCASHTIKIVQTDKAGGNGGKAIVLDYFKYTPCDSGTSYKCTTINTSGENKDGCTQEGSSCSPAVPTQFSPTQPPSQPTQPQDHQKNPTNSPTQIINQEPASQITIPYSNPNNQNKPSYPNILSPIGSLFSSVASQSLNALSTFKINIQNFLTQIAP